VIFILRWICWFGDSQGTGSFLLAILAGAAASGVAGLAIERDFCGSFINKTFHKFLVTFVLSTLSPT